MSKHKKTRQQKIIAQLRRELNLNKQVAISLPQEQKEQKTAFTYSPMHQQIPVQTYTYISSDLLKTAVLTGSIVIVEILLLFLSKNHILRLPI